MKISEAYQKYQIMPQLQEHMLRVAAVAKQMCDSFDQHIDSEAVITACLLHDMGNILKFNLDVFVPEYFGGLVTEDEMPHWRQVKAEFAAKYGDNEHEASLAIARELGVKPLVLDCIEAVDFSKSINNVKRPEFEPKICDDADMRVDPRGIVSIEKRLEDGNKRYKDNPDKWIPDDQRDALVNACYEEQRQIFAHTKIKPEDITPESSAPIIEQLRDYEI